MTEDFSAIEVIDRQPRRIGGLRAAIRTSAGRSGLVLAGAIFLLIIIGPHVVPYPPDAVAVGIPAAGPSVAHWFGTDELGRDVFSRFLAGGTQILLVPILAVSAAYVIGAVMGMMAGYIGGRWDTVFVRANDVLLSLPAILVAIILIIRLGSSFSILLIIVAVLFFPRIARITRGAVQNEKSMEYVLVAEAQGESRLRIVFFEILPNIATPLLVEYGIRVNFGVGFVASLSFLGLAAQPPGANWGLMISDGLSLILSNPWEAIAPSLAIAGFVISINFLTDAIASGVGRLG